MLWLIFLCNYLGRLHLLFLCSGIIIAFDHSLFSGYPELVSFSASAATSPLRTFSKVIMPLLFWNITAHKFPVPVFANFSPENLLSCSQSSVKLQHEHSDVILCGWLGSKHQLTNILFIICLFFQRTFILLTLAFVDSKISRISGVSKTDKAFSYVFLHITTFCIEPRRFVLSGPSTLDRF